MMDEPAEWPSKTADAAMQAEPTPRPTKLREPDDDALRLAEALVFSSAEPVTLSGLTRVLPDDIDAGALVDTLRARYAGCGIELANVAGGVMFRTAADLAPRLRQVIDTPRRLSQAAMETLAIIAYHQPTTRPQIEHFRGMSLSQHILDTLLELDLITPIGRREAPGRPTLWATTAAFLVHFGLKDLRELPRREDFLLQVMPHLPATKTAFDAGDAASMSCARPDERVKAQSGTESRTETGQWSDSLSRQSGSVSR